MARYTAKNTKIRTPTETKPNSETSSMAASAAAAATRPGTRRTSNDTVRPALGFGRLARQTVIAVSSTGERVPSTTVIPDSVT